MTAVFTTILFVIMVVWMIWAVFKHDEKHTADYDHGESKHSVKTALVLSAVIFFVVDGNLFYNSTTDTFRPISAWCSGGCAAARCPRRPMMQPRRA